MTGEADSLNSNSERLIFVKMVPEEQRLLFISELVVGLDHQWMSEFEVGLTQLGTHLDSEIGSIFDKIFIYFKNFFYNLTEKDTNTYNPVRRACRRQLAGCRSCPCSRPVQKWSLSRKFSAASGIRLIWSNDRPKLSQLIHAHTTKLSTIQMIWGIENGRKNYANG